MFGLVKRNIYRLVLPGVFFREEHLQLCNLTSNIVVMIMIELLIDIPNSQWYFLVLIRIVKQKTTVKEFTTHRLDLRLNHLDRVTKIQDLKILLVF